MRTLPDFPATKWFQFTAIWEMAGPPHPITNGISAFQFTAIWEMAVEIFLALLINFIVSIHGHLGDGR
ncbi:Uncharacterised protein [Avibacterium avium]|uniref:Uncharacterized protein n=1 Tax=Avibacterium avium TaxID=751 RepID=A0A379ATB4_AVIAV|nr:Uncharacterised protein [Avibacterium avium]